MISLRSVFASKAGKWTLFGLAALVAVQLYYVQEMIAALVIFSVLFAFVAGVALTLFILDRASQRSLDWVETRATRVAPAARQVFALAAEISKKPLHRQRSQIVP